jgi:glutamyl-tRNA reductase
MTKAIVQKILHDPIQHLKKDAEERDDYIRLIAELFQLDRDKPE